MDRAALSLLLRSFERHLRAENRSEHTIASYLESLPQAEAFLESRGSSLLDARREDLEAFLGELLQRRAPETVATRYRRLGVAVPVAGGGRGDQLHGANEATDRARPTHPRRAQGWAAAAAGGLRGRDFEARRDTAIVMFLLDTGARRGELADLQLTDLDLDLDVAIVPGKGRRERALPYGRKTAVALDRYPLAHAWLHKAAANRPDAACRLEVPPRCSAATAPRLPTPAPGRRTAAVAR